MAAIPKKGVEAPSDDAASHPDTPRAALFPILLALSANTLTKLSVAFAAGGLRYGLSVAAGLLIMIAAAWLPLLWIG